MFLKWFYERQRGKARSWIEDSIEIFVKGTSCPLALKCLFFTSGTILQHLFLLWNEQRVQTRYVLLFFDFVRTICSSTSFEKGNSNYWIFSTSTHFYDGAVNTFKRMKSSDLDGLNLLSHASLYARVMTCIVGLTRTNIYRHVKCGPLQHNTLFYRTCADPFWGG